MRIDPRSLAEAQRIFQANVSPRARRLEHLERYAIGTQYEGRKSFWDDDVPLQERAPCIVVPLGEVAAESNVDLCMGEGRAPKFSLAESENDSVFDPRLSLTEDDADALTRFLCAVCEQSDVISAAQELLQWAQQHGTTVALPSARNGELCIERLDAKWCTPTFEVTNPECVESIEIRYPFLKEYKIDTQTTGMKCMLYRRVIDAQRDVTYKPAPASDDGDEPDQWVEDSERVAVHDLGFCPVIWYKFGSRSTSSIDGTALHARVCDEIDALNFGRSQIHRAALYATDPQTVETGVDPDYNPAPMGRQAQTMYVPGANDDPANKGWVILGPDGNAARKGMPARRRGPGVVWRYERPDSSVELLTLPGDALKPAEDNVAQVFGILKEALGVVFLDPQHTKLGSDISGRTLEWLHARQVSKCNKIRKDFGRRMLIPLLQMLLRICLKSKAAIYLPGYALAKSLLQRFELEVEGAGKRWFGPDIKITWGPYFAPTATDAKAETDNVIAARDAGLITLKTAVEKISPYFGIANVAEYVEELEEEAAEKAKAAAEAMHALGGAAQQPSDDEGEPVIEK